MRPQNHATSAILLAALLLAAGAGLRAQQSAPEPPFPNPYLSFLPVGADPDMDLWSGRMRLAARRRAALLARRIVGTVSEVEPAGTMGDNDAPAFGEPLPEIGSLPGSNSVLAVGGSLVPEALPQGSAAEPDGDIPSARAVDLSVSPLVSFTGAIGDGAHGASGSGSGDFDFYRVAAAAGDRLMVAVRTPEALADLNPVVAVYDAAGQLLAWNDDFLTSGILDNLDSLVEITAPSAGDYFVGVGGSDGSGGLTNALPRNPFVASSGRGAVSEGSYELRLGRGVSTEDRDFYRLDLRRGDVISASLSGNAIELSLYDLVLGERVTAPVDLSGIYPGTSPLLGGGRAALAHVAERTGSYALGVARPGFFDTGGYEARLLIGRARLDRAPAPPRQVLQIDFDGALIEAGTFAFLTTERELSPLRDFLAHWGLTGAEEGALIGRVMQIVAENLDEDVRLRGGNGDVQASGILGEFDIDLRSSSSGDLWGQPGVSRIVVGGTIAELGATTIGLAESIDPGNYALEETAVVLLDLLSAATDNPSSLNAIVEGGGALKLELVARTLANLIAHEAGHLFSNFHTERDVGPTTLMDRGGLIAGIAGLGPDGIFGTADDVDVDFGPDSYEPAEGLRGVEATLETVSYSLAAAGMRTSLAASAASLEFGPVAVGEARSLSLRLVNDGHLPVRVQSVLLTSGSVFGFAVPPAMVSALPLELQADEALTFDVAFAPVAVGAVAGLLRVGSDALEEPAIEIALHGDGGLPQAALEPTSIDFGVLDYGPADVRRCASVELTNRGAGPLRVAAWDLVGADDEAFVFGGPAFAEPALFAGGATSFDLCFAPGGAVGDLRSRFSLRSSDPAQPRFDIELAGHARGPDLRVAPPSPYFFGSPVLGDSRLRAFRLRNAGNDTLDVVAMFLEGEDVGDFELDPVTVPSEIGPQAEVQVPVRFVPTEESLRQTTLRIISDDPDEPMLDVVLFGLGTQPHLAVSPAAIELGQVLRDRPQTRALEIRNVGSALLHLHSISLEGPQSDDFALDAPESTSLQPDGVLRPRLDFLASQSGRAEGWIRILSNDPEQPELLVMLGADVVGSPQEIPTLGPAGSMALLLLLAAAAARLLRLRRDRGT